MISSVKLLIQNLHEEKTKLQEENRQLKQKLSYRHTEISDLRYSKKQLMKHITKNISSGGAQ